MTEAHDQRITNTYVIHYPDHAPRTDDPHYKDFEHYRRTHVDTAKCAFGEDVDDYTECDLDNPLELHHAHVEFSLQNGVDLARLEHVYPGVSNPDEVGAWVESADNLVFLCQKHHRGVGGVHHASASDFEAERFVRGLIS